MANFLYLFRGGKMDGTPAEQQQSMQRWGAWMKELGAQGHFKGGEPLEGGGKVLKGKSKSVTDGPFAEAKDLVGGYLIVEAKDLMHATELARGCPIFEIDGSVEVRPIMHMSMP